MTGFDRFLLRVAPGLAARRATARHRAETVMNYDGASRGRRARTFKGPTTDADGAAYGQRSILRNRCRDLIRNRPLAARAQMVIAANVVGSGIRFSVDAEPAIKDLVEPVLRDHLATPAIDAFGQQDLYGLQNTVINGVFADGEILARRRWRTNGLDKVPLPFQVELLEVDYLDLTKTSHGNNRVAEGVEYGPTGRIEAYHLYREHPGNVAFPQRNTLVSDRVPAADVLHVRRMDRPGQLRGVPWLAPVMLPLAEVSDFQESEIVKQRLSSLIAVVVTTTEGGAKYNARGLSELSPGAVLSLDPDQDVKFTDPPEVNGYAAFMKQTLMTIAMGIGVTYESLSGDLTGTNYISFRAGRMEMDRLVECWQQQLMVAQFCSGIGHWIDEAWPFFLKALPQGSDLASVRSGGFRLNWTPPRRALVEPTKEIPAVLKSVDGRLTSRQRAIRQLGGDPEEIRREIAEDAAKDAALIPDNGEGTTNDT